MESNSVSSFERILRESLLIFLKNKSLMASIFSLIILLHSLIFTCKFFTMKFLLKDLTMDKTRLYLTRPGSSRHTNIAAAITEDIRLIFGLEWLFFLALSMASLFSSAITVVASSLTYAEANLSFRRLVSISVKSCPRLFITWFYLFLFEVGYFLLTFLSIFPFGVNFASPFHLTTFLYVILFLIIAFHMYLAVVWIMSIVVSVVEQNSYGLEAIGNASHILKGLKFQGFLLNLLYGVPDWIVFICWLMAIKRKGAYSSLFWDLIYLNVAYAIKMLLMVAYTVFYQKSKQISNGEEGELRGSFEYIKLPNEPMDITTS